MRQIAIIGGGSWGTALALALGRKGHRIRLWVFERELVESINHARRNALYLPEFELPDCVKASNALEDVLAGAEIVLTVVPSHHCRAVYQSMLPSLHPAMLLVSATKGIETETLLRMSEVIREVTAPAFQARVAVISGPSFAREVAKGDPTAIVVASEDVELAHLIQHEFSGPALRLYTNTDVAGVELGGAVKNVIAIAAGVCAGLGFGFNSLAALVTRGLSEMTRLAVACGGKRETLAGLAGMGDLLLTCTGELSRNRSVGVQLGQGGKLSDIIGGTRMVAEGVMTTSATLALAKKHQLEMPITEQMDGVLHHGKSPREAIRELMERRLKCE
ncbi:MAG: NAD(P)-dependent glycerol-3-phosphate dehydrogenase [Acidobacteria bacterium]|nr:NAD(P)-dependent glycerol-3-phosphate dehydrogenase [Acidobacteriota bacterium]MCI0623088.1 NAD(P)-dependent glycerol-3-phosphate dehydrogenase [Acidobacteriota bacterium]MCI0721854.1 NAD(P)-dependent glycerol-3-phosphate dehydrogenase [Acidobacteriota bacterium]